jgi:hypothetical protein
MFGSPYPHCPTCGKCPTCGRPQEFTFQPVVPMTNSGAVSLTFGVGPDVVMDDHHATSDSHGDDGDLLAGP